MSLSSSSSIDEWFRKGHVWIVFALLWSVSSLYLWYRDGTSYDTLTDVIMNALYLAAVVYSYVGLGMVDNGESPPKVRPNHTGSRHGGGGVGGKTSHDGGSN